MESSGDPARIDQVCRAYLQLLRSAPIGERDRLMALAESFDDLCAVYNRSQNVEPDTVDVETPRADPTQFGKMASTSFPELGFYPTADPLEPFEQEIGQGWGLDDLTDIAIDLTEVVWLIEQERQNDAVWQFRWGYENHWGHHLHELRLYLHKLLYWG